jgi:hypothetical protein
MKRTSWQRWHGGGAACVLFGAALLALLAAGDSRPADDKAKPEALPADLAKVPSDGLLVASARVADLPRSDFLKTVREKHKKEIEEDFEGFAKHFGLPLEQVERLTVVLVSPPPSPEEPLLFVRTVKPYELAKVLAAGKNAKAKKYKGETLYAGDKDWAVYPLDDRSLVYASYGELRGLIDHPKKEGNLAGAIRLAAGKHAAVCALNVEQIVNALGDKLPGEAEPFKPLLQARSAALVVDVGEHSRLTATATFAEEKHAKDAIKSAEDGLSLARVGLERMTKDLDDRKEAAGWVKLLKPFPESLKAARVEQKGETLSASVQVKIDPAAAGLVLLETVQKIRGSAARQVSVNHLRQIALAMHNYQDVYRRLPAHATYDKNGKPLLSWRVAILPFIEEKELYEQFHLGEPWDSEHNKKLLAKMPKLYASPPDEKAVKEHKTYFQGFVGKGAFFEGKQGLRIPADFPDGTSNTIMVIEASKAVPWTKPEDLVYDPDKPLPKLGLPGTHVFHAALCDGSVRSFTPKITQKTLRLAITRNDGQPLGPDF